MLLSFVSVLFALRLFFSTVLIKRKLLYIFTYFFKVYWFIYFSLVIYLVIHTYNIYLLSRSTAFSFIYERLHDEVRGSGFYFTGWNFTCNERYCLILNCASCATKLFGHELRNRSFVPNNFQSFVALLTFNCIEKRSLSESC